MNEVVKGREGMRRHEKEVAIDDGLLSDLVVDPAYRRIFQTKKQTSTLFIMFIILYIIRCIQPSLMYM